MNTISNACPKCGAMMEYNIEKQNWTCNYCKTEHTVETLNSNLKKYDTLKTNDLEEYYCSNCGASVVAGKDTISTSCLYCDSPVIIKQRLVEEYHPDYIIPFKRTKEEIINHFCSQRKFLTDTAFFEKENITSITNLYVPYWVVNCDVMGSIKGTSYGRNKHGTIYMNFTRMGKMKLANVPADAKTNLNNVYLRGIEPFNYDELVKFEYPYLAGMIAEKYDVSKEEIYKEQLKERIEYAMVEKLLSCGRGYNNPLIESKDIFINKEDYRYVLVPVWFVKLKYKNKNYIFCINDQTKKIAGIYQIGYLKELFLYAIVFALMFLFAFILFSSTGKDMRSLVIVGIAIIFSTGIVYNYISSYKNVKVINTTDYIKDGTFELMSSSDSQS